MEGRWLEELNWGSVQRNIRSEDREKMVWNVVLTRSTHLPFFIVCVCVCVCAPVCVPVVGISVFKLQDHLRTRSRARSELRGGAAAVAAAAWKGKAACGKCAANAPSLSQSQSASKSTPTTRRFIGQHCNDCGHTIVKTTTQAQNTEKGTGQAACGAAHARGTKASTATTTTTAEQLTAFCRTNSI